MYSAYFVKHNLTDNEAFLQEEMIPTVMNAFGVSDETRGLSESMVSKFFPGIDLTDFEKACIGMIDVSFI